jgi:hypothetical protein
VKIEIVKTDDGWELCASERTGAVIFDVSSQHETACEASREAVGLLRTWAAAEDGCKPMKLLWLVTGDSEKSDGFAHVVSADDRVGAVRAFAEQMGLLGGFSRDDRGEWRAVISMRSTIPEDGWEFGCARYFWAISVSPIELGVNMIEAEAWEWSEEEVRGCSSSDG